MGIRDSVPSACRSSYGLDLFLLTDELSTLPRRAESAEPVEFADARLTIDDNKVRLKDNSVIFSDKPSANWKIIFDLNFDSLVMFDKAKGNVCLDLC